MNNTTEIQINHSLRKHYALEPQITWYWCLRITISTITIFGNGFVVVLIMARRSLQVTCNWFILSLAISDFCVGLFITPTGLACSYWVRCDWRPQLVFYNFFLFASTLNLWAMTYDRYNAFVCPLKYITRMTTKRTIIIISLPWVISLLASFIRLLWLYDKTLRAKVDIYYRIIIDIWFGIFSCLLLVAIYVRILAIIGKHSRHVVSQRAQLSFNTNNRMRCRNERARISAKILGVVIALFVACYVISIYVSFCSNFKICSPSTNVQITSILMVHVNCTINFIVYALLKKDFRAELRRFFKCENEVFPTIRGISLTRLSGRSRH